MGVCSQKVLSPTEVIVKGLSFACITMALLTVLEQFLEIHLGIGILSEIALYSFDPCIISPNYLLHCCSCSAPQSFW